MMPKTNTLDESNDFIQEIESSLEKTLVKRREEIERELQERIRKEKEESDRRLSQIEGEIAKERETLKEYRGTISSFESERDTLQDEIKVHLDRSIGYQKDIEQLTALTLEELRVLADLTARLTELRDRTELKVTDIRGRLKEKYGVITEPLDKREGGDVVVNLEKELSKLRRIQALLERDSSAEPEPVVGLGNAVPEDAIELMPDIVPVTAPFAGPAPSEMSLPEEAVEPPHAPAAEVKMPEINLFIEEFVKKEGEASGDVPLGDFPLPKWQEEKAVVPVPPAEVAEVAAVAEVSFEAVFESLEKHRKSEPTDYNGEISFFKNDKTTILDGETIVRAMSHLVDDGRKLYQKLTVTESPKDQFFIKQDLINHQEILRKIVLRAVKLCERENNRLPRYTEDVLSVASLKETLDKLNLDNWSNKEEFEAFESQTARLKDAFYKKITPPAFYLKSILDELGA
ncbi:MAG: hypothetical protein JW843_05470 [Candidatus Aminicenantes bacterium]|nr:hypothetical protein [Candidatus Aminicenantes bacterium]